jgi:hypothetical protein
MTSTLHDLSEQDLLQRIALSREKADEVRKRLEGIEKHKVWNLRTPEPDFTLAMTQISPQYECTFHVLTVLLGMVWVFGSQNHALHCLKSVHHSNATVDTCAKDLLAAQFQVTQYGAQLDSALESTTAAAEVLVKQHSDPGVGFTSFADLSQFVEADK